MNCFKPGTSKFPECGGVSGVLVHVEGTPTPCMKSYVDKGHAMARGHIVGHRRRSEMNVQIVSHLLFLGLFLFKVENRVVPLAFCFPIRHPPDPSFGLRRIQKGVRPPPLTVVPTMTALMAGRPSLKALSTSHYHLVALGYHLCLDPGTSGIPSAAPSGFATNLHLCVFASLHVFASLE